MVTYKYKFRTRKRAQSTADALKRAHHTKVYVFKQTLAKPHVFTVNGQRVASKTVYRISYDH